MAAALPADGSDAPDRGGEVADFARTVRDSQHAEMFQMQRYAGIG
ncbi:hypothetical protein [Nonomuraea sp. NPDC003754]